MAENKLLTKTQQKMLSNPCYHSLQDQIESLSKKNLKFNSGLKETLQLFQELIEIIKKITNGMGVNWNDIGKLDDLKQKINQLRIKD